MKNKNKKRAYETMEFIEDIRVNKFLENKLIHQVLMKMCHL